MPRNVGRPPDSLFAQLRAYIINPSTTDREIGYLEGSLQAFVAERAQPKERKPKVGEEIPLREPG